LNLSGSAQRDSTVARTSGRGSRPMRKLNYRPSSVSIPARTSCSSARCSLPTFSGSNRRSRLAIWETFAAESFGKPVSLAGSRTLPGDSARSRLLVSETQTAVEIRRWLNESPWTTTTGAAKTRPGAGGCRQVRPPYCSLGNLPFGLLQYPARYNVHERVDLIADLVADAIDGLGHLVSAMATQILAQSLAMYRWLRVLRARRARRSALWKTSSGTEIAVFIL
jgi:hypothetical protein